MLIKFNKPEDFLESDKWYYRGYYHQLNLYLHIAINQGEKIAGGVFILRSLTGDWKEIYMSYDPDRSYEILEKAKAVNYYVEKKEYPEPLWKVKPEEIKVCLTCDYKHLCLTEMGGAEKIIFEDNEEILEILRERESLEEYAERYQELTEKIKQAFIPDRSIQIDMLNKNDTERFYIFDKYVIKQKLYWQTEYKIPQEIKQKYAEKVPRCRISIEYL